jgi:hypothetical protein
MDFCWTMPFIRMETNGFYWGAFASRVSLCSIMALARKRLPNTRPGLMPFSYNLLSGHFVKCIVTCLQSLSSVNFVTPSADPIVEPSGSRGSTNLGLGLGVIYDNRHNVLNVRDGMFSELSVFRYAPAWGSDFTFTRLISDTRIYRPVNDRDVVAAQVLGQFNLGDVPFNQLALMGGENMMRGYYLGRYRDKNMVTAQAEYRFLPLPLGFTKRIGAAVFGSTGTVFNDFSNLTPRNLVWAGGGGLRFLLFPKRDIYTRLDVAFTSEGTGLYIFVGESF